MRVTSRSTAWAVCLLAAALLAGCSHNGDESQIESLVRDYLGAIAAHDPQTFADDVSSTCHLDMAQLQAAFASVQGQDISLDVQSVDVTDLTQTTATATVNGTATFQGHTVPMNGVSGQTNSFKVVKEGGAWRIATCPNTSSFAPGGSG